VEQKAPVAEPGASSAAGQLHPCKQGPRPKDESQKGGAVASALLLGQQCSHQQAVVLITPFGQSQRRDRPSPPGCSARPAATLSPPKPRMRKVATPVESHGPVKGRSNHAEGGRGTVDLGDRNADD
jgi:hypothetical protein